MSIKKKIRTGKPRLQNDKGLVSRIKNKNKTTDQREKVIGSLIEKCARDLNKHFRGSRKCKHIKVVQPYWSSEKHKATVKYHYSSG